VVVVVVVAAAAVVAVLLLLLLLLALDDEGINETIDEVAPPLKRACPVERCGIPWSRECVEAPTPATKNPEAEDD
jgi:hypothetical protein